MRRSPPPVAAELGHKIRFQNSNFVYARSPAYSGPVFLVFKFLQTWTVQTSSAETWVLVIRILAVRRPVAQVLGVQQVREGEGAGGEGTHLD